MAESLNLLWGMTTMDALDTLQGSMGMAYITMDGRRYKFLSLTKFKATGEINIKEVPILGRSNKGNKPGGMKNSFEGTAYYNIPVVRKMLQKYQDTGVLPTFILEIYNQDPMAPNAGMQAVILNGCMLESGTWTQVDATTEWLEEDIKGVFDRAEVPKHFNYLPGM